MTCAERCSLRSNLSRQIILKNNNSNSCNGAFIISVIQALMTPQPGNEWSFHLCFERGPAGPEALSGLLHSCLCFTGHCLLGASLRMTNRSHNPIIALQCLHWKYKKTNIFFCSIYVPSCSKITLTSLLKNKKYDLLYNLEVQFLILSL